MTSEKLRVARNLAEDMEHDIGELIQDELKYLEEALEDASGKLSEAIKGEDDAVHEAKVEVNIDRILDETYALVGILQRGAEDMTACGIRTGAYEEARTLLEK